MVYQKSTGCLSRCHLGILDRNCVLEITLRLTHLAFGVPGQIVLVSSSELRESRVFLPQLLQMVHFVWRGQPLQQLRLDCHGYCVHAQLRVYQITLDLSQFLYRC